MYFRIGYKLVLECPSPNVPPRQYERALPKTCTARFPLPKCPAVAPLAPWMHWEKVRVG